jgi:beta-glucosidase-like glycosyl hydrolase
LNPDKPDGNKTVGFGGHGYANSESAVTALGIKGGCDMDCGVTYFNGIEAAVANGGLKESDLDTAIERAFAMRMRLGMFDEHVPYRDMGKYGRAAMDSFEGKALALQAALRPDAFDARFGALLRRLEADADIQTFNADSQVFEGKHRAEETAAAASTGASTLLVLV